MRSNLLSLQAIAGQQSVTQNRLATGLKVNSAIDNASSFYSASALSNRASDLSQLLDSMTQGVQTLKAVSNALEIGTKYLEQAKAAANQTLDKISTNKLPYMGPIAARVSTQTDLLAALSANKEGVIVVENDIMMSKNVGLTLKSNQKIVGKNFVDGSGQTAKITFNFDSNTKAIGIEMAQNSELSDLEVDYFTAQKTSNTNFHAVYNDGKTGVKLNNLKIITDTTAANGNYMAGIYNTSNATVELSGIINITTNATVGSWNLGIYNQNNSAQLIQTEDSVLNIKVFGEYGHGLTGGKNIFNGTVNISTAGSQGHGIMNGINTINGTVNITTTDAYSVGLGWGNQVINGTMNITTIGDFGYGVQGNISTINGIMNVTTLGLKSYGIQDSTNTIKSTGKLLLDVKNVGSQTFKDSTTNYQRGATIGTSKGNGLWQATANEASSVNFSGEIDATWAGLAKIGNWPGISAFLLENGLSHSARNAKTNEFHTTNFSTSLKAREDILSGGVQYNTILSQYNDLIKDTSYKGINLLLSQNMKINFNEKRTSGVNVDGVDASTKGLGLEEVEWKSANDIERTIAGLDNAIGKLRDFASEFGNYHSVVSSREIFTKAIINVLTEGADKLTLANMNEESANTLALQTRQQLAVNSLSLASSAGQSILKLF